MALPLLSWRESPAVISPQNENLLTKAFLENYNRAIADDYNAKSAAAQRSGLPVWDDPGQVCVSYTSLGNIRVPAVGENPIVGSGTPGYSLFSVTSLYYAQAGGTLGSNRLFCRTEQTQCLDFMPRLFVSITPLKDYLINLRDTSTVGAPIWVYENAGGYTMGGSGIQFGFNFKTPVDYTSFIENSDGYYVISNLTFYTNTPGETQTALGSLTPGHYNSKYEIYCPMQVVVFPNNPERYTQEIGIGYYGSLMNNTGALSTYRQGKFIYNNIFFGSGQNYASITGEGLLSPLWNPYQSQHNVPPYTSANSAPYAAFAYYTKKDLERLLDAGGCPWSYDLDKVTSPDGSGLRGPTMPGQPSNPVDTGDGDGDNMSDSIEYPNLKYTPNAYKRYWLTSGEVNSFKDFLFKGTFLDNVKRLWTEPAEYIIDLSYFPLNPQQLGFSGEAQEITVGDIGSGVNGLIMPDNSTLQIYVGSVDITRYYNSYLDYEPYTSIDIYLPYIGVRSLNTSQIMGHTLKVAYYLDVNTLQITAALGLDGDMTLSGGSLGNVLTQYTSSFGVRFPLSGTAANQMILNVVQQVAGVVSGTAALVGGVATGNAAAIAGGAATSAGALLSGGQTTPITYGSISPMSGLYAPQLPYLIINRPISAEPETWANDMGYSAGYSGKVSDFSGYLEAFHVELSRADTMTEIEAERIISALEGGILI